MTPSAMLSVMEEGRRRPSEPAVPHDPPTRPDTEQEG
jgi:hypothetical protein